MKSIKRLTALLLAMAMCLSLLSANVWAAEIAEETEASSFSSVEENVDAEGSDDTEGPVSEDAANEEPEADEAEAEEVSEENTHADAVGENDSDVDESSQSETGAETDHAEIPEGQNADQSEGENVEKAEDPDSDSETQTALSPQGTFNDKDIVNSESGITRGEWMHNLAVMFELTTDNDGVSDAYYPDLTTSTQYFKDIWAVIDAGAVALEPGKNLRAGDSLTRDFAAATLNYFLGYQMEGSSYSFSDSADCTDPGSAQVAVNRGWFALSGGKFLPNQAVTSAEVIAMTKDAKQALKESTISAGGNSQYTFADNVVVFPKGVSLSFNEDNSVVTIGDTTTSVSKGDTFVVWLTSDLPGIYRADSVNKTGGNQIISISDADVDNALLDVNASGSMDVDLSTFEGADGTEAQYVETNLQAQELSELYTMDVKKGSVVLPVNIPLGNGTKFSAVVNLSDLKLSYKDTSSCAVVTLDGNYAITSSVSLDVISASGASKMLTIGRVRVLGVGLITVSLDLQLNGKATYTQTGHFSAELKSTLSGTSAHFTNTKNVFYCDVEANTSLGLKVDCSLDLYIARGGVTFTTGLAARYTSHDYNDGKKPNNCSQLNGWMYAKAVSSATIGVGKLKKNIYKPVTLYDMTYSPAYVMFHWEDGKKVNSCSRGNSWYFTNANSRYGSSSRGGGSSTGVGSDGVEVPIYTYTLDEDNNATITGYKGNAAALNIPDTIDGYKVVKIGDRAFNGNKKIAVVIIPNSVIEIGNWAFNNCTTLNSVMLPASLEILGSDSFSNCISLGTISIPKTLKKASATWGAPFSGSGIRSANIENGMTTLPDSLFRDASKLTTVDIPNTVTNIESWAFSGCTQLQNVELPSHLTEIGSKTFNSCSSLTSIRIPKTLTKASATWGGPFYDSGITTANIENGMTTLPDSLFRDASKLTTVDIPNTVTNIESWAFSGCTQLKNVVLPSHLTEIGSKTFNSCSSLTSIRIPKTLTKASATWGGPFCGSGITTANIEEGMTIIPDGLFNGASDLSSFSFPKSATDIGSGTFTNCSSLNTITIPETVKIIGGRTFSSCTSLKSIILPNSLTSLGEHLFDGCTALKNVTINNTQQTITSYMFRNCTALEEITLPDTVTTIQGHAFEGCTALKTIHWSKSLNQINSYAFENCEALEQIDVPATVTSVGEGAFYNCNGLKKATIPDSVISFGKKVFYDCDALANVSLGTGLTALPESAFEHCDVLEALVVPYNVATIGKNCFKDSVKFAEITIPRATTKIDKSAFSYPDKLTIYGVGGTYAETFAKENSIKFVDKQVAATQVTLPQKEVTLSKGASQKLILTVAPENTTDLITWKSSDTKIATVSDDGTVKAVGTGSATIKVTVGSVSATCKVTVVQAVTSISLNKTSVSLDAAGTFQLKATAYPSDAGNREIEWSSSAPDVASVDNTGLVTAHAKGSAIITAKAKDGSGVTKDCTVTVANSAFVAKSVSDLESEHNYPNNCSDLWIYTIQGAAALDVTFDSRTDIEEGFDYLYLYDYAGNEIGKYTGTVLAGKTITITGNTVKIKLVSDKEGNTWGFKVSSVTKNEEQSDDPIPEPDPTPAPQVKLTATKLSKVTVKKNVATVTWKKNTTGKGYQLQYSTDKKFKKSVKTVKISKNKTVKTTVKKLKKGTWYFRIRTVKGKKYSGWSAVKKVKVAK